jgi:hypothetical protein
MTTTVDIRTINLKGEPETVYHGSTTSIKAALRLIDGSAPACVNRYVRRRLHRDQGGLVEIGMVSAKVDVTV